MDDSSKGIRDVSSSDREIQREGVAKPRFSFIGSKQDWNPLDTADLEKYAREHPGVRASTVTRNIKFSKPYAQMGVTKKLARIREAERKRAVDAGEPIQEWAYPNQLTKRDLSSVHDALKANPKGNLRALAEELQGKGIPISYSNLRGQKIKVFGALNSEYKRAKAAQNKKRAAEIRAHTKKRKKEIEEKKKRKELEKEERRKVREASAKLREEKSRTKQMILADLRAGLRFKKFQADWLRLLRGLYGEHRISRCKQRDLLATVERQSSALRKKFQRVQFSLYAQQFDKLSAQLKADKQQLALEAAARKKLDRDLELLNRPFKLKVSKEPKVRVPKEPKPKAEPKPTTQKGVVPVAAAEDRRIADEAAFKRVRIKAERDELKAKKEAKRLEDKTRRVKEKEQKKLARLNAPKPSKRKSKNQEIGTSSARTEKVLPVRERLTFFMTRDQLEAKQAEENARRYSILDRLPPMKKTLLIGSVRRYGSHYTTAEISDLFNMSTTYIEAARAETGVVEEIEPLARKKLRKSDPWPEYSRFVRRRGY